MAGRTLAALEGEGGTSPLSNASLGGGGGLRLGTMSAGEISCGAVDFNTPKPSVPRGPSVVRNFWPVKLTLYPSGPPSDEVLQNTVPGRHFHRPAKRMGTEDAQGACALASRLF